MRKIYFIDLFSALSNDAFSFDGVEKFPADNDPNYSKTVERFETETHIIKKEIWIGADGKSSYVKTHSEPKSKRIQNIKALESMLKEAVEKEEYEMAAVIRDEINKIK